METTLQDTLQFAELFGSMVAFVEDKEIEYDLPTSMEISTFLAAVAFLKDIDDEIQSLIDKRQQARANKDWATADAIRDELKAKGIILKDTPQGVTWVKE